MCARTWAPRPRRKRPPLASASSQALDCGDHRAAREGDGDAGEHVDVGGDGQRAAGQVGGAAGLGDDEAGESGGGGPTSDFTGPAERLSRQHGIELQRRGLAGQGVGGGHGRVSVAA